MDRTPSPRAPFPRADEAWRDRPIARACFASDLHLHRGDPAGVERAVRFLRHVRETGADALFLLGDVFRAWMGPRSLADPGLRPFLDGLAGLCAGGMRVALLHGNHDFLLGQHVHGALGVQVAGQLDLALGGQRVRLLHGDALCTRDVGYHRLHRVLRSRGFRALVRALPPAASDALADRIIDGADHATHAKTQQEMDIVEDAVLDHLATGVDVLVCGHVHYARDVVLSSADSAVRGRLLVLADFERSGSHAVFEAGRLTLVGHDPRFARPPGPVIAIDGPAGSGKSAVSRLLAERLGWALLDSGALYRAVTARALQAGAAPGSPELAALVASLRMETLADGSVRLEGAVVPDAVLRGPEVSAQVSPVSSDPAVRAALLPVQRGAAVRFAGLVAEGRDMASVVFPQAVLAVFLDARPEVRAQRRAAQHPGEGRAVQEVQSALRERDERDSSRQHAPLRQADSAVRLETSDLTLVQVVDRLQALLAERSAPPAPASPAPGAREAPTAQARVAHPENL